MANAAIWFEIYVQDMERAKAFYETVLDRKLERLASPDIEMWAFPMDYHSVGAGGALVKADKVPSGGNSTLIYFHSIDCAIEEARVVAAGGRISRPKLSIGQYGAITLAIDTEGNMFGIHSM